MDKCAGPAQPSRAASDSSSDRIQQSFLAQQDSQRIHFLAGAAAGDPDLERWISAQDRHNHLAQRAIVAQIGSNSPSSRNKIASEYTSSPVLQPATQILSDG